MEVFPRVSVSVLVSFVSVSVSSVSSVSGLRPRKTFFTTDAETSKEYLFCLAVVLGEREREKEREREREREKEREREDGREGERPTVETA